MFYAQTEFDIRCEWGMQGLEKLATISNIVIIVDVLSFSTLAYLPSNLIRL